MNIHDIQRSPVTVRVAGRPKQVERLDLALPFARKPANLQAVIDGLYASMPCKIYVERVLCLTTQEFDAFAANFYAQQPWLDNRQGGGIDTADDGAVCVQVTAAGRPVLFVNSEGYGYARQVACLP